jgi:hypothetical protein
MLLTADMLRKILRYDPETGEFTWIISPRRDIPPGSRAGSMNKGYRTIMVDHRNYAGHRLAWLWVTGEWPAEDLDHINRDRGDNRFANLRLSTDSQNLANRGRNSNNTSGLKGVTRRGSDRWIAQIGVGSTNHYLGIFYCPAAAHIAYVIAADKAFGKFARSS